MNQSRTATRKRTERRGPKVQKTFGTPIGPGGEAMSGELPTQDSMSFPYRTALANWPDEWRERWGYRANALEETGLGWRAAEARAFFEVQEERRAEVGVQSIPLITLDLDRN